MTPERFAKLNPGDIVRGIHSGDAYVITSQLANNWDDDAPRYIGTRTIVICTPEEWELKQGVTSKPDPFTEWYGRTALSHDACGYDCDDLRLAFEAGMKAEK